MHVCTRTDGRTELRALGTQSSKQQAHGGTIDTLWGGEGYGGWMPRGTWEGWGGEGHTMVWYGYGMHGCIMGEGFGMGQPGTYMHTQQEIENPKGIGLTYLLVSAFWHPPGTKNAGSRFVKGCCVSWAILGGGVEWVLGLRGTERCRGVSLPWLGLGIAVCI